MKTVLVADDEDNLRDLVAATLEGGSRYRLLLARDGLEALALAKKECPDLVFLDVKMPMMDGYEVCRRLKADPQTARAVVVLLTGLIHETDRAAGLKAGADQYLTKPFSPTKLLRTVEAIIGGR